ncbi:ABC ATPase [Cryptosporidium canis]|uniref:ABC ATPase n=1 Tax=Cryptosporidium canis TaxID=195482 RepID=A0A9D5DK92_9CRYT|nr:ABC ATPase [Cryptosporidium canis]
MTKEICTAGQIDMCEWTSRQGLAEKASLRGQSSLHCKMLGGLFRKEATKEGKNEITEDREPFLPERTGGITPEENASIWSRLTFSWFTPIIDSAYDHVLAMDEYYHLPERDNPSYSLDTFEDRWRAECDRFEKTRGLVDKHEESLGLQGQSRTGRRPRSPSLYRVLMQCYKREISLVFLLVVLSNICSMYQIVLLRKLLEIMQSSESTSASESSPQAARAPWWAVILGVVPNKFNFTIAYKGLVCVFFMTLFTIAYALLRQQETRIVTGLGRKLRSLIMSLVYRKLLDMDSSIFTENTPSNLESTSRASKARLSVASDISHQAANVSFGMSGNVVNLLSNDVARFGKLYNCHEFYYGVGSVITATIFLYFNIGISGVIGILVMLVHAAWSIGFLNLRAFVRGKFSEIRDGRILLTSEYLNFIKIIKSYSWEKYFIRNINTQRQKELFSLVNQAICWGLSTACHAVVFHALLFTIIVRRFRGEIVDPANIFFAYVLYDTVSEFLVSFPRSYALFKDIILSCERISDFLVLEDRTVLDQNRNSIAIPKTLQAEFSGKKNALQDCSTSVRYEGVELRWPNGTVLLRDLSFDVRSGEIMAVLGPVGCGKSGLLLSIINEIQPCRGNLRVNGQLAYVPQLAWVITGTIRENITFGAHFDPDWYAKVVHACCLAADFKIFPNGDQTMVSGSSNNLSGGQRQRISLARAVYQNSQIYALDDCLSAVDSSVSAMIFKNCILGLLRDKCVILATHLANLATRVDKVLLLDGSTKKPLYLGDPCELARFPQYKSILEDDETGIPKHKQGQDLRTAISGNSPQRGRRTSVSHTYNSAQSSTLEEMALAEVGSDLLLARPECAEDEDNEEDNEAEGVVSFDTYKKYVFSYNKFALLVLSLCVLALVAMYVLITFFIGYWAENFNEESWTTNYRFYLAACIIFPIVCILTTILFRLSGVKISKYYHDKLLSHIEFAPLEFFETTPIGRILNRFTSDLVQLDELLPTSFNNSVVTVLMSSTMMVSIAIVTPQFIAFVPPIFYAFYCVSKKYPPILRQGERKSAALSAPITSQLMETMSGLATIHTFRAEEMLIRKMEEAIISLNNIRYHLDIAYIWLYLRLEVIGCMTLVTTGVFSVLLSACSLSNSGILGTILSFAVAMPGWLRYSIFTLGEFEADLVGFERIRAYTDSEMYQIVSPSVENDITETPKDWPSNGKIEFKNVDITFYPNPNPSLRNICLNILPGERIGIVGRTGAGKSSLFSALLRLFDTSFGTILIDDVDISKVPHITLRESISIVPQDPTIFTGTVRFNLDPKGNCSDGELYQVLKRAHIFEFINSLPGRLDHQLEGGGAQLSVGIKQLFCLARAILRKSKILLLDEATSFVDIQTDALIQETIRSEFKGCTILTIAHRINTIINYDRILVLESGRVFEFDTPQNLLRNPKSVFSSLASSLTA